MSTSLQVDVEVTPDQNQAQQMAASELANPKYHNLPAAQSSVTALPTIGAPTTPPPPPPPTSSTTTSDPTVILVIIGAIVLVLVLVLVLRTIGKPRAEKDEKAKKKKKKSEADSGAGETAVFDEELFGAARHRRSAEQAAAAGQWAEAIRERFRAVISTLDERGLLPERPERTADEAARDAGEILPQQHREPLSAAARAFDEVEYGRYLGSSEGYARICAVDEQIVAAAGHGHGLPVVRR